MEYLQWIIIIIGAWFLADFLTGVFHWIQDQFLAEGKTKIKFINKIATENDLHHDKPAVMGKRTLWENTTTSLILSIPLFVLCYLSSAPIVVWLSIYFGIFANAIHSFTHKPKIRIPRGVQWLQKLGMFQSTQHHAVHHFNKGKIITKEDTTIHYCVMTNYINPILDGIRFFPAVEFVLNLVGITSHRLQKLQSNA